ncbi:MAG: NAD(P)H-dependent oxidoreductase subunit E [Erysipelotrichaceae bacterium]
MSKLNTQSIATIKAIVEKHQGAQGPVKLMLHDVQHELGYIPFEAMEQIADAANTSVAEVYGVVTFYTQFTTQPKGKHVINVCMGTACYVKGSQDILDKLSEMTQCAVNATSADGMYSLDATRCLGACGLAPVVIVDGKVYGSLTVDTLNVISLLQEDEH